MRYLIHGSSSDWFLHQVIGAIIHSAIYGMVYKIFKNLSAAESVMTGVAFLFCAWLIYRMLCKNC